LISNLPMTPSISHTQSLAQPGLGSCTTVITVVQSRYDTLLYSRLSQTKAMSGEPVIDLDRSSHLVLHLKLSDLARENTNTTFMGTAIQVTTPS